MPGGRTAGKAPRDRAGSCRARRGMVTRLVGLAVFFGITYLFVRHLERQDIYSRL